MALRCLGLGVTAGVQDVSKVALRRSKRATSKYWLPVALRVWPPVVFKIFFNEFRNIIQTF